MPHLRPPDNACGLSKIDGCIVVAFYICVAEIRLTEVLHLSPGLESRATGGRFQRSDLEPVSAQPEVSFSGPGKRTVVLQRRVGLSQQDIAVVGPAEERVAHIR